MASSAPFASQPRRQRDGLRGTSFGPQTQVLLWLYKAKPVANSCFPSDFQAPELGESPEAGEYGPEPQYGVGDDRQRGHLGVPRLLTSRNRLETDSKSTRNQWKRLRAWALWSVLRLFVSNSAPKA